MLDYKIQHTSYSAEKEMSPVSKKKGEPKQSRPGDKIIHMTTTSFDGREATTTKGAIVILEEITKHKYSRDSVYRMYLDGKIEGVRTDIANYYYIDSIRKAAQRLRLPEGKKRKGRNKTYSPETRKQALELHEQGLTNRQVADHVGATNQIVNHWIRQKRLSEQSANSS